MGKENMMTNILNTKDSQQRDKYKTKDKWNVHSKSALKLKYHYYVRYKGLNTPMKRQI